MVRASRSIVDPVKTYAAPVTASNVTNLSGRKPADACTLAPLPLPLLAVTPAVEVEADGRQGRRAPPHLALSVISLLRGNSIAFGCEADKRTVDRSNQSDANDPKPRFIRLSSCQGRPTTPRLG